MSHWAISQLAWIIYDDQCKVKNLALDFNTRSIQYAAKIYSQVQVGC